MAPNVTCLDYNIAAPKGSKLFAYRWDGDWKLEAGKIERVSRVPIGKHR